MSSDPTSASGVPLERRSLTFRSTWWAERKRPRAGRVPVRIGEALRFTELANDRAGWEAVASRLQTAVEAPR